MQNKNSMTVRKAFVFQLKCTWIFNKSAMMESEKNQILRREIKKTSH